MNTPPAFDMPKLFEKTWSFSGPTFRSQWINSRDTDAVPALPDLVRDALWKSNDAIRR
ncbi:hypothetical protein JF531_01770 [Microbacterium esteraromaticum]|uniref:hypothetical protein n=1 Tax=Microbacterium esteraromaticum TaxID=57043 RepID=UPI001A8F9CF7|nr:hypothetical protein [Microbacterium esteraromaticum]MBN8423245.1 hypothetical protein [Microbacterium esteraromaticum]